MPEEAVQQEVEETQEVQSQVSDEVNLDNPDETAEAMLGSSEESEDQEQTEDELQEQKEELKELKKRLKLKVNGREIEEEVDFNDDERLTRDLQKARAFETTSQELATLRKEVQGLVQQLQNDPASVLAQLGYDVDEFAEQRLAQKVEEMKKSPEQLEREKMQKELEEYKRKIEENEKKAQEAQLEQLRNEHAQKIESEISEALESSTAQLPPSPKVVRDIALAMKVAIDKGYKDVTPKDVIPIVERRFKNDIQQMFGKMPEEMLEQMIGKDNLERLRKKRLNKRKKAKTQTANQVAQNSTNSVPPTTKKDDGDSEPKKFSDVFGMTF